MYISMGMNYGMHVLYGWDSVAILVGAFLGPLLVWLLSRFINRKHVVLIALALTALSGILAVSANQGLQVVIGGGFVGLSNTMMLTAACLWQVENADSWRRGPKVVLLLVAAGTGNALCSWITFIINRTYPSIVGVRVAVGIQLVFVLAAAVMVFIATDSYRQVMTTIYSVQPC